MPAFAGEDTSLQNKTDILCVLLPSACSVGLASSAFLQHTQPIYANHTGHPRKPQHCAPVHPTVEAAAAGNYSECASGELLLPPCTWKNLQIRLDGRFAMEPLTYELLACEVRSTCSAEQLEEKLCKFITTVVWKNPLLGFIRLPKHTFSCRTAKKLY